jgi:succinyl-diaminopimelate desuccinylase
MISCSSHTHPDGPQREIGKENQPVHLISLDQSSLDLTCALVRYQSQTPDDAGCLSHMRHLLIDKGFDAQLVPFNQTQNLYARWGTQSPFLLFVGHVDVVPPGDSAAWSSDPFTPTIQDGFLYGRGTADMKGAIACFLRAMLDSLAAGEIGGPVIDGQGTVDQGAVDKETGGQETVDQNQRTSQRTSQPGGGGSIGLLLTSDEEGPGHDGVKRMVGWLKAQGVTIDHVLIGEPTGDVTGSVLQIGRRGSVTAQVMAHGVQSHIAYITPDENPAVGLVHCLHDLATQRLDEPDDGLTQNPFPPTCLQITALSSDDIAVNVTPAKAQANFGIRYGTRACAKTIEETLRHTCRKHLGDRHTLTVSQNGAPFLTQDPDWIACGKLAITEITGQKDVPITTQGGTTDGRFMSALAPVIEIGLPQTTIHQIDERIPVQDLETLTAIYRALLRRYGQSAKNASDKN